MTGVASANAEFAGLTGILVGPDYDMIEFLQRLTDVCRAVGGVTGAGIVVTDQRGDLRDIAYSSEFVRRLESLQIRDGEGPCLDCHRQGVQIVVDDLATAVERWPSFAPAALELGVRSVRAVPLRLDGTTVGTLNLFGAEVAQAQPADTDLVQPLADLAVVALLQRRYDRPQAAVAEISAALADRSAVERAKGVLAEAGGVDMDAASALLRARAQRTGNSVAAVARSLLGGQLMPDAVLAPPD